MFLIQLLTELFGTGTTTASSTQTALVSEQYRSLIVSSVKTVASGIYDIELRLPITQMNTQTLTELGLFNASSGGTMYGRMVLNSSISKSSDDEYVFSVRIKILTSNN